MLEMLIQDTLDRILISPVRTKTDYTPALAAIGLQPSELTQESGQLLIHKGRCLEGLAAVTLLNSNSHRELTYAGLHGDKDTFRAAFRAVGAPYHYIGQAPALGGHVDELGIFRDSCFVQTGLGPLQATPLFVHFCGRHRHDDDSRLSLGPADVARGDLHKRIVPPACMSADGRPFRLWPFDGRRGYMRGRVMSWSMKYSAYT